MKKMIDIIAVTYGHNEQLKCFINSIRAQTYDNWRLFIVHDGPNEELLNILNSQGYLGDTIKFIQHPIRTEKYGHVLRGWGLQNLLQGEYVLITNADNYYTPNMIEEVSKIEDDFIYFDCVHSHPTGYNYNKSSYGYMNCGLSEGNIDMGCVVVKSKIAKSVGFNSTDFAADWHYFREILNTNPTITKINKILFVHN